MVLFDNDVDVDICIYNGFSLLFVVCYKGYINIVKLLLKKDVIINIIDKYGVCFLYIIC